MLYNTSFKTRRGNTCRIEIITGGDYTTEYPVALTPAADPFEMETDDDTDIDTVLRPTTGTLRLIMTSTTLVYDIMPSVPLGTSVRVFLTDESTGVEKLKFHGFIEMGEYSQPWMAPPYEQEFPVFDAIGAMDYARVPLQTDDRYMGMSRKLNYILATCLDNFKIRDTAAVTEVMVVGDQATGSLSGQSLFNTLVPWEWMMEEATEADGTTGKTDAVRGCTWSDALEKIFAAKCLTMWIEGEILCLRYYGLEPLTGGSFFHYSVFDYSTFANADFQARDVKSVSAALSFADLVEVQGDGGDTTVLPPCGTLTVKQSLQKRAIFELDSSCLTHSIILADIGSDRGDYFGFSSQTSQRGVTVKRYATDGSNREELTGRYTPPGFVYQKSDGSEYDIVGGMLLSGASYDDRWEQAAIPEPSQTGIVMVPGPRTTEGYNDYSEGINIYSTVGVSANIAGCLRISGQFKVIQCTTSSSTSGNIKYYMAEEPKNGTASNQYGTVLRMELLAYTIGSSGGIATYNYQPANGWVGNGTATFQVIFRDNGSLMPNSNTGVLAEIRAYSSAFVGERETTRTTHYDSDEVFGTSVRFLYDDGGPLFVPLDGLPSGHYSIRIRVWATRYPDDYLDGSVGVRNSAYFYNTRVLVMLHDFKVEWCPKVYNGTMPDFDEGSGGSSSLSRIPLVEETAYTCQNCGDGENVEVSLDTWGGNGDGTDKWGNTVQPDLCDTSRFEAAARQMAQERIMIDVEDAYLAEQPVDRSADDYCVTDCCDAKNHYTRIPGYTSGDFVRQGGTWNAATETGRLRFVQFH